MIIKLPIQTKELKDDKLVKEVIEKGFDLDTSLASQIRFEARFPELAKDEDIFEYTKRIAENNQISAAALISKLKVLYCWIDTNIDFIEFIKLIDLSDLEYIKELTSKIKYAFDIIFNSSSEKN